MMKLQCTAFRLNGKAMFRLLPFIFVLILSACGKDGDAGPQGNAGKDGNADVTVFNFGAMTINGGAVNLTLNITQGRMDSSFLLMYFNPEAEVASAWYPIPGLGSGAMYETRYLTYQSSPAGQPSQYTVAIRLMTPAGAVYPTAVKLRKLRIFVVPAGKLVNGRQASPVDYKDYQAVLKYYGIGS